MRTETTFPKEGRGDRPRQLANATTLATIGTRVITQMRDFCCCLVLLGVADF